MVDGGDTLLTGRTNHRQGVFMLRSLRQVRISAPLVISSLALLVAMGGTGYSAVLINGGDIAKGTVSGKALKNKTVKGAKVDDDTLTGDQIKESTLGQVPSAAAAAPTGAAGGGLTGTYPNPGLANGSVTATKIGTIVERNATSSNIPAGSSGDATASCLAGEKLIAGGSDGYYDVYVVAEAKSGNGWRVSVKNVSSGNRTVTAHAYCLQ
jgi:hypothetical protein